MRSLRTGERAELTWEQGAVGCRVVAAAGSYVLVRPERSIGVPSGRCSLTYLDGMVPLGWDGAVEAGAHPSELRFRVADTERPADRRSSVRVPLTVPVRLTASVALAGGVPLEAQTLDVSAGGIRLRRSGTLPAGTPVHVRAELPGGLLLDADAEVRASLAGTLSLAFTAMHGASIAELGAWTVSVLRRSLVAG